MNYIEEYDFFSKNKKDFYAQFHHTSFLIQGKHWDKPPFVTIIITTYKRPVLLKQALESALNQKNFNDYQILIADNEGKPIEEETATARIVKSYQDDKIIYYRHSQELIFKENAAVALAKSPWIVFLHDDDLMVENHLAVMTSIVKKYREIKFLGCNVKKFRTEQNLDINKVNICNYSIKKYLNDATCLGEWAGWTGALISKKHYIAMGGMPAVAMGCGDKVMVYIFQHHYGTYICNSDKALYFYREGEQQSSFAQKEAWEKTLINEYYFYKYVIRKYHRYTYRIWERNIAYHILQLCEGYNKGFYHTSIDISNVISQCGMPKDINERNRLYNVTKCLFNKYRSFILFLDYIKVDILRKSDIHITI